VTDGLGGIRLAGAFLDERGWPAGLQTPHVTSDRATERRKNKEQPTSERRRGTVTIDLTKATRPLGRRVHAARDVEALDTVVRGRPARAGATRSVAIGLHRRAFRYRRGSGIPVPNSAWSWSDSHRLAASRHFG